MRDWRCLLMALFLLFLSPANRVRPEQLQVRTGPDIYRVTSHGIYGTIAPEP